MGTPWYASIPHHGVTAPEDGYAVGPLFIPASRLASPEGHPWPKHEPYRTRLLHLLEEYAAICELAGGELRIVHAHQLRGPHSRGYALDIAPPPEMIVLWLDALAKTRRRMPGSRLFGIGINPDWLHIDILPRSCRVQWHVRNPLHAW